jgi:hypothetical protein
VIESGSVGGGAPLVSFAEHKGQSGPVIVPPEVISLEFPKTLDLRIPASFQGGEIE